MWYLYLDESGDLGFDFVNKKPSRFFTITILAISSSDADKALRKAVKKTLRRKLNHGKKKRMVHELKGSSTVFEIKEYFYEQIKDLKFGVYSITLNKKRVYERLTKRKERVYNYVTKKVLDKIPFEKNNGERINFTVDKSKGKPEILEFNNYIKRNLEARVDPKTPIDFNHGSSQDIANLQACDLFCWGIFQKYERGNKDWYGKYAKKIKFDDQYL
jgi:hypothetical protein